MASVTLSGISKRFGAVVAVEHVDLDIRNGEFVTLLGPSGCGKTTTLRMIAGLERPNEGRVRLGGEDVTDRPPRHRNIGMVFQDYALFPHLSVGENIAFGLRERRVARSETKRRVRELLDLVRLPGVEHRFPAELSGGQQQRVALARALAFTPRVLLMDEPLGALDLKLREAMQLEVHRIQRELAITTVYVTHDQEEAMNLSDRIAVMAEGRVLQVGSGEDLYLRPATPFVAQFIGQINLFEGRVLGREDRFYSVELAAGDRILVPPEPGMSAGQRITIAVRPECLVLVHHGMEALPNVLWATIERRRFSGNVCHYFLRLASGQTVMAEGPGRGEPPASAEKVRMAWAPDDSIVFPLT